MRSKLIPIPYHENYEYDILYTDCAERYLDLLEERYGIEEVVVFTKFIRDFLKSDRLNFFISYFDLSCVNDNKKYVLFFAFELADIRQYFMKNRQLKVPSEL